jgi:hypothetical protein
MEDGQLWENEQLDCILQVVKIRNDALGAKAEFSCVKDCGQHLFDEITREEYETNSEAIDAEMLVFAESLAELAELFGEETKPHYDFEQDLAGILERINDGSLLIRRKRTQC